MCSCLERQLNVKPSPLKAFELMFGGTSRSGKRSVKHKIDVKVRREITGVRSSDEPYTGEVLCMVASVEVRTTRLKPTQVRHYQ